MATSSVTTPLSGLNPDHPERAPGAALSPTPRQSRELAALLRAAPDRGSVLREVREALGQRRPLLRILDDLRARNAQHALRAASARPPETDRPAKPRSRPPAAATPRPG